jgi:hypothetical protein
VSEPSRQLPRICSLLAGLLLASGCDPNVVIGARRLHGDTGGVTDTGGMPMLSGSGGVPAGGGGIAGDAALAGSATEAGGPTAGAPSEAGAAGAPDAGVIFSTGNEGSLADWDGGPDMDAGGYYADPGEPLPKYAADGIAHSGEGAAKVTINADGSMDKISRLYRRIEPGVEEAYYLAWFYLNEDHTPSSWWSVFLFRANQNRSDSTDLWSLDLVRTPQNKLTVALYEHQFDNGAGKDKGRTINASQQQIVPVKVWFQVQAYLRAKAGSPSKVVIWLDGTEVINLDSTTPAPDGMSLYWVIGNGAGKLTPAQSTVYVDDAQISTSFVRP